MSAAEAPAIRLVGFPVETYQRAAEHQAALQRELDLIRIGEPDPESIPERLSALLHELNERFEGAANAMLLLGELVDSGRPEADVVIPVFGSPAAAADAIDRLRELMDDVDDYCRAGDHLLTLATPADLARFRAWLFGEIVDQLRGSAPVPWPEFVRGPAGSGTVDHEPRPAARSVKLPEGWSLVRDESGVRLVLVGVLDLDTAEQLREVLQSLLVEDQADVIIDLRAIGFIDSVGLSVLVAAHLRFEKDGATLHLDLPQRLRRLFEIAGLSEVLHLNEVE